MFGAQPSGRWTGREGGYSRELDKTILRHQGHPETGLLSSFTMAEDQGNGAKEQILLESNLSALSSVVSLMVLGPCLSWVWQTDRKPPPDLTLT